MAVHTCPRCELRFSTTAELDEHLSLDHHVDPEKFDRWHYKTRSARPPTKRIIVVANQTLSEPGVIDRLAGLANGAHLHLVAPATPSAATNRMDDKGLALATYRLRHAVSELKKRGVDAEGEVGNHDPVRAVARAIEHEPADEIVIATLPKGASKWLEVDVPQALERGFGLPVTTLTIDRH